MPLYLVGGGSRSGKSRQALMLARRFGARFAFVATAQAFDDEMAERIRHHQHERGPEFTTFEEPVAVGELLPQLDTRFDAILVDCLTLWASNLLLAGHYNLAAEGRRLVAAAAGARSPVVLVTNEVGCGIVPDNALARRFRDEAGWLNQHAAEHATEVYFMAFGLPLQLK